MLSGVKNSEGNKKRVTVPGEAVIVHDCTLNCPHFGEFYRHLKNRLVEEVVTRKPHHSRIVIFFKDRRQWIRVRIKVRSKVKVRGGISDDLRWESG